MYLADSGYYNDTYEHFDPIKTDKATKLKNINKDIMTRQTELTGDLMPPINEKIKKAIDTFCRKYDRFI